MPVVRRCETEGGRQERCNYRLIQRVPASQKVRTKALRRPSLFEASNFRRTNSCSIIYYLVFGIFALLVTCCGSEQDHALATTVIRDYDAALMSESLSNPSLAHAAGSPRATSTYDLRGWGVFCSRGGADCGDGSGDGCSSLDWAPPIISSSMGTLGSECHTVVLLFN